MRVLGGLPRKGTSPVKWPILTLFPFLAQPRLHLFLKPEATKQAARNMRFELNYRPAPNWLTYSRLLEFAKQLRRTMSDWHPRDMIDMHSFIWVTGGGGYADAPLE